MSDLLKSVSESGSKEELYLKYSLYISQGFLITLVNSLIVIAIIRSPQLRNKKEYIIVGGLALADVWNALGFLTAGSYRSYLIYTDQHNDTVTAWSCMKTVHNFFFIVGEPLSGIFLTAVSLDRLLAVAIPMTYFTWQRSYRLYLSGGFYLYAVVSALVGVIISYVSSGEPDHYKVCFTRSAINNDIYTVYNYGLRAVGSVMSVVLYAAVAVVYVVKQKKRKQRVGTTTGNAQRRDSQQQNTQRRLMKTLGISSIFTLIFAIIPNGVMSIFADQMTAETYQALAPYVLSVGNLNPLLNIFLYTFRHDEMKKAVVSLLTCKHVPEGITPPVARPRKYIQNNKPANKKNST